MIKRVYQIADVHIPTYKRLEMYATQLEKLIKMIRADFEESGLSSDEVRIVICGDIVESKNVVTNELVVFVSSFIRELSNIGRVLCIAGNHDLIESNTSRTDTVTGIFQTAQFPNAVFIDMALGYESGVMVDENITWALYSIYDDFQTPDIEGAKETMPNNLIVGLFHGMIVGSKLWNGFICDCGEEANVFEGCDYVMAGHIHKRQIIKQGDCEIVYVGSPIQHNYGESLTEHGFAVWDIENKTYKFIDVPSNEYGYYDISLKSFDDIDNDREQLNNY